MKQGVIVFLTVLMFAGYGKLNACSCEWLGPFLTVAKGAPLVAVVKIKKYIYYTGSIPAAMEVEVIELLKGDPSIKTAKVWGDTGILCRPYIKVFMSDSVWAIALRPSKSEGYFRHPDEKEGDYYIDECGTYLLSVKQNMVNGLIQNVNYNDPPQIMTLSDFTTTAKKVLTSTDKMTIPTKFELSQNYPNPFNPETIIQYTIPVETRRSESLQHVTLVIYDLLGREVVTLVDEYKQPGTYEVKLNIGHFERSREMSSGVYFYQFRAGIFLETKKMMVMK